MKQRQRERERRNEPVAGDQGVLHIEYIAPSPQVRDVSASGIYLNDPRQLQVGQTVKLRLKLGSAAPFVISGMVRRVDPGEGFAIEFIQLDAADRRRIKEHIARQPGRASPAGRDELG